MRGASLREVQEILGHRTFAMTLRYSHLSPSHLRTAVDWLDGLTPAPKTPADDAAMAHEMAQSAKIDAERAVTP
jgi:hypothetical protein